jgi:hypothetical protein
MTKTAILAALITSAFLAPAMILAIKDAPVRHHAYLVAPG